MSGLVEPKGSSATKHEIWERRIDELNKARKLEAADIVKKIEDRWRINNPDFVHFMDEHTRKDAPPLSEAEREKLDKLMDRSKLGLEQDALEWAAHNRKFHDLENEARQDAGLPSIKAQPIIYFDHDWAKPSLEPDVSPLELDNYVPDHEPPTPDLDWEIGD